MSLKQDIEKVFIEMNAIEATDIASLVRACTGNESLTDEEITAACLELYAEGAITIAAHGVVPAALGSL